MNNTVKRAINTVNNFLFFMTALLLILLNGSIPKNSAYYTVRMFYKSKIRIKKLTASKFWTFFNL